MNSWLGLLTMSTLTTTCMRQALCTSTLSRLHARSQQSIRRFRISTSTSTRSAQGTLVGLRGGHSNGSNGRKSPMTLSSALGLGLTAFGIASSTTALCAEASEGVSKNEFLYPPIKAYKEDYIKVDDRHTLYYHCYGNPTGKPVLFIHGGPGGGTDPDNVR